MKMKDLVSKHLASVSDDSIIKISIYYKTRRLSDFIIRNKPTISREVSEHDHVMYQFKCDRTGCNSMQYIRLTTCAVIKSSRCTPRTARLKKHLQDKHRINRIERKKLLDATTVLARYSEKRRLRLMEALFIKSGKPEINSQLETFHTLTLS